VALRCLIVDDNRSFLDAASSLLEREGLTVVGVASSVAEALWRAQQLGPDVVLVDVTLGAESGFDLARRLVESDSWGPTIVLISTHAEADFADLIEETPAAGFVSKSELSARAIQRLVGGSASASREK
jgi:CheY-like chemotaxis protein